MNQPVEIPPLPPNVIVGAFDPQVRLAIIQLHYSPTQMIFKSVNEISELTGAPISMVKAILKRKNKYLAEYNFQVG